MASNVVTGAMPHNERTPTPEWCAPVLARLADAAAGLGYSISADAPDLAGSRGRTRLHATCSANRVGIELVEEAGPIVGVHVSRDMGPTFVLEVVGNYPDAGNVSQTAVLEDITADAPRGSLTFAADTHEGWAFVEFDLAGEVLSEGGDAAEVNDRFGPVLATSATWKDAHTLTLALAGLWSPEAGPSATVMGVAIEVAVPNPRGGYGVKKSIIGQALACGAAAITCTVAATWFPPAGGGCVSQSSICALAIGCAITSCAD